MSWKTILRPLGVLATAVGLAAGAAACGSSGGGSGTHAAVTLKLGYVTTPQHPYGIALAAFANAVTTASKGRIEIDLIPSYQGGDVALLNDVRGGTVPMASVSSAIWDTQGVDSFQALQAPFLVNRYDVESQVIGGPIGKAMLAGVGKLGLVGLAIHEGGLRKPLGRTKPLLKPADFAGLKIRAPESRVLAAGLRALGAEPTPLPVTDVYLALKNGTVDGMEANLGLIQTNKYYEVAKYVTQNVNLWPFPTVLVMNRAAFDGLSASDQKVLTDAAATLPATSIGILTKPAPTAPNFVQLLCGEGLTFAFASKADQAALATSAKTAVSELSKDPVVKSFIARITAIKDAAPAPTPPPPLPAGCSQLAGK